MGRSVWRKILSEEIKPLKVFVGYDSREDLAYEVCKYSLHRKNKKDLKESLQILQTWFSPSFPVGSFSYSHGLEAMINDNFIKSKEDILDYLKCILKYGTGKNDVILIKYTSEGEELNELALSLCPSKERKIESIEMGNAFRKVLADSWDFKILENTAYPIAVAKAAKHFGIPLNLTIVSYLQSFVSNLISVCIKHIPIGQKIGQDCIIKTYDLIREIEKESQNLNLEDLGGICFNSDIYSIIVSYTHLTLPTNREV